MKKKSSDKLSVWKGPGVLVAKEKHGDRYFDSSTPEAFFKACLTLVKERLTPDYGYYFPPTEVKTPSLSKEAAEVLPDGPVRAAAVREWAQYIAAVKAYERDLKMFEAAKLAVESEDGLLAWTVLSMRKDYEYEYISQEPFEKV